MLMPAPLRAGCEPWSTWEGIDPKSEEYRKLKEERAQVLMDAVEVLFWAMKCVNHEGVLFITRNALPCGMRWRSI